MESNFSQIIGDILNSETRIWSIITTLSLVALLALLAQQYGGDLFSQSADESSENDEITTHGMRILYICLSVILSLPLVFAGPLAVIPLGVIPFYTLVSFVKAKDGLNDKQFTWGLIVPIIVLLPASLLGDGVAYQEMTDHSCWGI